MSFLLKRDCIFTSSLSNFGKWKPHIIL